MTNRFYSPDQQFLSNSGVPYAGGFLYFYATGTSTPLNTYSDRALSIANTNPVVLDSNGQAGSVFLQNLAYKVVLEDSNSNQIWTMDPVYTSDYSTFAQFQPYNGNPNGFVAGTAGTVGTLPGTSAVWDYVDNILYICTTSGNAATAVWTSTSSNATSPTVTPPQGYLTLSSDPANPILTADTLASAFVYYTPYVGNQVPVYNGSQFLTPQFIQLGLTLASGSQTASTLYDVFVFSNSGVLTLVTGPAWASSTPGSCSRGSGAGSTQLQRLNGIWVNEAQITGKNNTSTYTIPANTATYLGSIFIDATAGQISCNVSYGQSRKWGVWNAYNRVSISLQAGDSTTSWTTAPTTWRQSNAATGNFAAAFTGLPEEFVTATFVQQLQNLITDSVSEASIGIGLNSTTTLTGIAGSNQLNTSITLGAIRLYSNAVAQATVAPTLGISQLNMIEQAPVGTTNNTYYGTSANMVLTVNYRG